MLNPPGMTHELQDALLASQSRKNKPTTAGRHGALAATHRLGRHEIFPVYEPERAHEQHGDERHRPAADDHAISRLRGERRVCNALASQRVSNSTRAAGKSVSAVQAACARGRRRFLPTQRTTTNVGSGSEPVPLRYGPPTGAGGGGDSRRSGKWVIPAGCATECRDEGVRHCIHQLVRAWRSEADGEHGFSRLLLGFWTAAQQEASSISLPHRRSIGRGPLDRAVVGRVDGCGSDEQELTCSGVGNGAKPQR